MSHVRTRLTFDEVVALHPGTPTTTGPSSVRVPCPSCAANSYVIAHTADDEPVTAFCSTHDGGKPRSAHIDLGCTRANVARALGMTESVYTKALAGVRPYGLDGIDWTSLGVMEDLDRARLVLRHARATNRDIAFCYEMSSTAGWLLWDGTIWAPAHSIGALVAEVSDHLADAAAALFDEARAETDEDASKSLQARANAVMRSAREARKARDIDNTAKVLRDLPGVVVTLADFDANPCLLQAANGVIDLRTGEIREPRKEDRITCRLAVNYRPEAAAPTWDRFLSDVFIREDGSPDPETVAYMRRLIGYGITGSTKEQCFVVMHGKGGNGKGVFANVLSSIFRPITATTPFSTFEERAKGSIPNDIAALRDARLVLASEGEAGRPMAEAVIKSVTGSDPITARFMRAEFFTFTPQFLILLATNNRPSLRGQDEGLWRRVKLIPFRARFTYAEGNRDDNIERTLMEQAEGVLAWAVRGSVEWNETGLDEPACITAETASYRRESDRLGDFLAERVNVTGEHLDVVSLKDAFAAYLDWASDERDDRPMRRQNFGEALSERPGIRRDIRSKVVVFRNVKLRTVAEMKAADHAATRADRSVSIVGEVSA